MKKPYLYFALLSILPALFLTGGAESQLRFIYYIIIVLLIPVLISKDILQAALTFSILYSLLPLLKTGEYPLYTIIINSVSFILMAIASGRLADILKKDRDALQSTNDIFHGLTNTLNLKIMNLQAKVDSLTEAYARIQESDKNKTFFISNVSHELRSPLSSIRSFSEILQTYDDIDAETSKEFLAIINGESERLTQLTNEILDFSRIDSGKVEWHMDYVSMEDVVRSAVKTIIPLANNKGLHVETIIPDNLPLIRGDSNKLFQVLLNLLSNAIKFTSQGKITVGIENMHDKIKTFVSDTGEGIYPEEKEKIFDEFYRIGEELQGRPAGSGLGLSISKKIVEAHSGNINVESEIGQGSTFFFLLPKSASSVKGTDKVTGEISLTEHAKGDRLLIVDDSTPMRQILRGSLENIGYTTMGANFKLAQQITKAVRPDLIIIGYPESREYFDEIRTLSKLQGTPLVHTFVINDEKTGPQIAVNNFISSPFDSFQIHSIIEEVLRKQTGRILIISENSEEARNLQVCVGSNGFETIIIPVIEAAEFKRPLPDAVIIGSSSRDKIFKTVVLLRGNQITRKIPIILSLNILIRDMKCIGLGYSDYGNGLDRLQTVLDEMRGADAGNYRFN
jgi:signal transduction histidine kinase/CheY-like chemotaxis protein